MLRRRLSCIRIKRIKGVNPPNAYTLRARMHKKSRCLPVFAWKWRAKWKIKLNRKNVFRASDESQCGTTYCGTRAKYHYYFAHRVHKALARTVRSQLIRVYDACAARAGFSAKRTEFQSPQRAHIRLVRARLGPLLCLTHTHTHWRRRLFRVWIMTLHNRRASERHAWIPSASACSGRLRRMLGDSVELERQQFIEPASNKHAHKFISERHERQFAWDSEGTGSTSNYNAQESQRKQCFPLSKHKPSAYLMLRRQAVAFRLWWYMHATGLNRCNSSSSCKTLELQPT